MTTKTTDPTLGDRYLIVGPEHPDRLTWDQGEEFVRGLKQNGFTDYQQPYRRWQSVAFGNVPELFQPEAYWSCEQHASDSGNAYFQGYSYGGQDYISKGYRFRVRVFRSVLIRSLDHSIIPPALGAHWDEQGGVYAGVVRGLATDAVEVAPIPEAPSVVAEAQPAEHSDKRLAEMLRVADLELKRRGYKVEPYASGGYAVTKVVTL